MSATRKQFVESIVHFAGLLNELPEEALEKVEKWEFKDADTLLSGLYYSVEEYEIE